MSYFLVLVFGILTSLVTGFEISYSKSPDHTCSPEIGVVGTQSCESSHVKVHHFVSNHFINVLQTIDSNVLVRKAMIDIHIPDLSASVDAIGSTLDIFITPRPWWLIVSESYSEHVTNSSQYAYHIFLVRYSPKWEPFFHVAGAVQFPPKEVCDESPLFLMRMLDKGWGSQMNLMEVFVNDRWKIYNIWDSVRNEPDETMMYASKGTCPNLVNKRECMFLPITNCTMPAFLTETHGPDTARKCWHDDFLQYTNSSSKGVPAEGGHGRGNSPSNSYQKAVFERFPARSMPRFEQARFIDALGHVLKEVDQEGKVHSPMVPGILLPQALTMRPNALYRKMIMKKVHDFRVKHNFHMGTECTSIHIRRGDRMPEHESDIKKYCSQYKRFSNNGSCYAVARPYVDSDKCAQTTDFGCFSQMPFGAAQLTDFLKQARALQDSKTVFIMTDDGPWLKEQIAGLSSEWRDWRLLTMPAEYDRHSPGHDEKARNHETDNGVEFMSSFTLARQCNGYVGHFASGLTISMFRAMCFQHGFTTGRCPMAADIGFEYTPDGNQIW